jgi:hypothetical protein
MYMNQKIEALFVYAEVYEKMLKGDASIHKKSLAYKFVELICQSRIDLIFLLNEEVLLNMSRIEQLKLMKIICDIYGAPSTWKNYEGKPKVGGALLALEKQYTEAFNKGNFFNFSYGFDDFHDHLSAEEQQRVDEEIIMLADQAVRPMSLWFNFRWKVKSVFRSLKRLGRKDYSDLPF